jgi:hypothetical protein
MWRRKRRPIECFHRLGRGRKREEVYERAILGVSAGFLGTSHGDLGQAPSKGDKVETLSNS